jgi:hypothetical protein
MPPSRPPPPVPRHPVNVPPLSKQERGQTKSFPERAAPDTQIEYLSHLTLPELIAWSQSKKAYLQMVNDNLQKIAVRKYKLKDPQKALCALAFQKGRTCPTDVADFKKRRLFGQSLERCQDFCYPTTMSFWNTLVTWIYHNVYVASVRANGVVYEGQVFEGGEDAPLVEPDFTLVTTDIQYNLETTQSFRPADERDEEINAKFYNSLSAWVSARPGAAWQILQVFPKWLRAIKIINLNGEGVLYNERDDLGGNNIPLPMDYHDSFLVTPSSPQGPLTLGMFADGLFRIKSHKFETFYELFLNIARIEYTPQMDQVILDLNFEFGT